MQHSFISPLAVRAYVPQGRRPTSSCNATINASRSRSVVWIRHGDCRTVDHPGLAAAARSDETAVVAHADNDPDVLEALDAALRPLDVELTIIDGEDEAAAIADFTQKFGAVDIHVRLDETDESRTVIGRAARILPNDIALRTWADEYRNWNSDALEDIPYEYPMYKRWMRSKGTTFESIQPAEQLTAPSQMPVLRNSENRVLGQPGKQYAEFMARYAEDSVGANAVLMERAGRTADEYGEAIVRAFLESSDRYEEPDLARTLTPVLRNGLLSSRRMRELTIAYERENGRLWRAVYREGASQLLNYLDAREYAQLLARSDLEDGRTVDGAHEARFWRWNGLLVRYVATGPSTDAPPVLLVHGFGASAQHYSGSIPLLARKYRVYALDLVGYGRSEKPPAHYTPDFWQLVLTDFVREVVGGPVYVAGNSIGGYFATAFAADNHPELCAGAVQLNSAGKIDDPEGTPEPKLGPLAGLFSFGGDVVRNWRPARMLAANFLLRNLQGRIQATLQAVYPTNPEKADAALAQEIRRNSLDFGADYVLASGLALPPQRSLSVLLDKYEGPLLLYNGVLDPLSGRGSGRADKIKSVYPEATVVKRELGHCPHDEDPDDFADVFSQWMSEKNEESDRNVAVESGAELERLELRA